MGWLNRILYLIGYWFLIYTVMQIFPLLAAITLGQDKVVTSFAMSIIINGMLGGALYLGFRGLSQAYTIRIWVLLPFIGIIASAISMSLPFAFYYEDVSYAQILFEGVSIVTTTGSSALRIGVTEPYALVLWRAIGSWIGGFGAIVLILTILTRFNSGALNFHRSPLTYGRDKDGFALIRSVTEALLPLYCYLTFACFFMLWVFDMPGSISLVHALTIISTAGIGLDGLGGAVEISGMLMFITSVFLAISCINLDVLLGIGRLSGHKPVRCVEYRVFGELLVFGFIGLYLIQLIVGHSIGLNETLFGLLSTMSTTGWYTADFLSLVRENLAISVALVFFVVIGSGVATTGGGIGILRFVILIIQGRAELSRLAHPHGVIRLKLGRQIIESRDLQAIWMLTVGFILSLIIGALILSVMNIPFQDAIALSIAAMTTTGPIAELISPYFTGYGGLMDGEYIVLSCLMIIGRLDTSLFLVFFARFFWRG